MKTLIAPGVSPKDHEWFVLVSGVWQLGFLVGNIFHIGTEESCNKWIAENRYEQFDIRFPDFMTDQFLSLGKPLALRLDIFGPVETPDFLTGKRN